MALTKNVADRIHQVTDAFTNWFIVEDGHGAGLTVVDTGFPRSWRSLHHALRELRRGTRDIEAVVLTHAHFDHMGFALRAQQELGVPLWAHEKEVDVVRHPWKYDHEQPRIKYALRYPRFLAIFTAMGAQGALFVKGTDKIRTHGSSGELDLPGRPRIVFTPGHTHGHCSLHFPDRGTLIAGDAVVTLDPYTGRRGPQIVSGAATADSATALESQQARGGGFLERLVGPHLTRKDEHGGLAAVEATRAQTVLTGHGAPWREGAAAAANRAREAGPS